MDSLIDHHTPGWLEATGPVTAIQQGGAHNAAEVDLIKPSVLKK